MADDSNPMSAGGVTTGRETRRTWWERRALAAARARTGWPRQLQRLGTVLLVLAPFTLFLLLEGLNRALSADAQKALDRAFEAHPFVLLGLTCAMLILALRGVTYVLFRLNYFGRQLQAEGRSIALPSAVVPAVLFLRPFSADAAAIPGFRQRLAIMRENVLVSMEEQLSEVLAPIGPLIAVGNPGETLATPGAARAYVDDAHWHAVVRDWLDRTRLVIMLPGVSEGVRWEIAEVFHSVRPTAVLLLLPRMARCDYEALQRALRATCNIALPAFGAVSRWRHVSGFVSFDDAWRATFLPLAAPWLRTNPFRPMQAQFNHALRPVFTRLGVPWQPSRVAALRAALLAFLALTVVLLLSMP
jgi:hypothetical protein